jgi:hypothetical protein
MSAEQSASQDAVAMAVAVVVILAATWASVRMEGRAWRPPFFWRKRRG